MAEELESTRYEPPSIDLGNRNSSQVLIIEMTGEGKKVLEIGTSTGHMSKILKERGNQLIGIEKDEAARDIARQYCESMIIGDIEEIDLDKYIELSSVHAIILGDLLEHIVSPGSLLEKVKKYLRPNGYLLVSLYNTCHGDVTLNLLSVDFKYTTAGLLDETHLKFFGIKNIIQLFNRYGYTITDLDTTTVPMESTELELEPGKIPRELFEFIKSTSNSDTYQFVFKALPSRSPHNEFPTEADLNHLFEELIENLLAEEIGVLKRRLRN